MCDKGFMEDYPDYMKLAGCIVFSPAIQKEIVEGISKLIGEPVKIAKPILGENEYDKLDSEIRIETVRQEGFNRIVVYFKLQQLPGCCGVLVSYNTYVIPSYRGKGINSFLQEIKEKIARENNYTTIMATTTSENAAEVHILEKYGWKRIHEFINKRTKNTVYTYIKTLE